MTPGRDNGPSGKTRGAPGPGEAERVRWMKRALALAARARGDTNHYPMVGAVIVKNGEKIAEGYFRRPGEPHAEVHALRRAGDRARGADIYVNLEPCSHYGTTPPCAKAVIEAGIKRVIGGMTDPNPLVAGRGYDMCRKAGLDVIAGVLEPECVDFNRVFVRYITAGRPWVTMKAASTLDGKIAALSGDAFWITGEAARKEAHKLRDINTGIMVGAGTVRADDPSLTVRMAGKGRHPRPIILSSSLDLPLGAKVMKTPAEGGPLIFTTRAAGKQRIAAFTKAGAEVAVVKKTRDGRPDLDKVMDELGKRKIASVMAEGGSGLFGSLLRQGLVDEVVLFLAPKLLGGDGIPLTSGKAPDKIADALDLSDMRCKMAGRDLMITGRLRP